MAVIEEPDVERFLTCVRALPTNRSHDVYDDFIINLFLCVLDLRMHTTTVNKALDFYRTNRWDEVRNAKDLEGVLARFADDQAGNTALAQYIWSNKHWTRADMLRRRVLFFTSIGVIDQTSLVEWASTSDFQRDFQGQVKDLGYAVYQWLVMRCEVDTVKPDVHTRRFGETCLGRPLKDSEVVDVVTRTAEKLGIPARALDLAIWEHQTRAR